MADPNLYFRPSGQVYARPDEASRLDRVPAAGIHDHHYSKSHWNLLTKKERWAVIAMFQSYIKKQEINQLPNKQSDPKEDSNE